MCTHCLQFEDEASNPDKRIWDLLKSRLKEPIRFTMISPRKSGFKVTKKLWNPQSVISNMET